MKIEGMDDIPIYTLSEEQRKFLQFTIPFDLFDESDGGEYWIGEVCKRGTYSINEQRKLKELREEYIKRLKEHNVNIRKTI